jgi:ubiquinone/menaquinone biosynthesis C-methylase UbiE
VHDSDGRHAEPSFDTSSSAEFVSYYARESLSSATQRRFLAIYERVLRFTETSGGLKAPYRILDIGCGPGAQCLIWASRGHHVIGLDVNASLIEIARKRAEDANLPVRFDVGTATALPYDSESVDICLVPELLEHVRDWQPCVREAIRVLRRGGTLFLSTTNVLCPVQHEFNLPFYSWYPVRAKRHVEHLAVTTRRDLANHARYPAVHWFSYYGLSRFLRAQGMITRDRFEVIDLEQVSPVKRLALQVLRSSSTTRFVGQFLSSATIIYATKA